MLKVVGASLEQTRLTQFLLLIVIGIAIFAIFFYEASPLSNDGCYAATAVWSDKTGFRIEFWGQNNDPQMVKQHAARAYYRPKQKSTGWASIEIETNPDHDDTVQARAAGILEGSLSWQLIYQHWQNTVGDVCQKRPSFCSDIKDILQTNYDKVREYANQYDRVDPYWHQVSLFYTQIEGLKEGWDLGVKRSRVKHIELEFTDFLWMNHVDDIRDLELKLEDNHPYNPQHPPADLMVLVHSPNTDSKFLLAHQTSGLYNEMLKVMKRYSFGYHDSSDKEKQSLVPGTKISLTSYPGAVHSQDDFYQISGESRLQVVGSRIKILNPKAWHHTHLKTVLMGGRIMAANRLARTAEHWAQLVKRYNSGTGTKEWIAIDKLNPFPNLWLVEQVPRMTTLMDITNQWREKGYWISCGIPHTEEIIAEVGPSGTAAGQEEMEYIRDYLEKGVGEVTNTGSLHDLLHSSDIIKRMRGDLVNSESVDSNHSKSIEANSEKVGLFQKQTVPGKGLSGKTQKAASRFLSGIIDTKMAYDLFDFQARAGPLFSLDDDKPVTPFQWSGVRGSFHIGQPDTWDFDYKSPAFVW